MYTLLLLSASRIKLPPAALFKERIFWSIYATRRLLSSLPPEKPFAGKKHGFNFASGG